MRPLLITADTGAGYNLIRKDHLPEDWQRFLVEDPKLPELGDANGNLIDIEAVVHLSERLGNTILWGTLPDRGAIIRRSRTRNVVHEKSCGPHLLQESGDRPPPGVHRPDSAVAQRSPNGTGPLRWRNANRDAKTSSEENAGNAHRPADNPC